MIQLDRVRHDHPQRLIRRHACVASQYGVETVVGIRREDFLRDQRPIGTERIEIGLRLQHFLQCWNHAYLQPWARACRPEAARSSVTTLCPKSSNARSQNLGATICRPKGKSFASDQKAGMDSVG